MAMVEATFELDGYQFGGENDDVVVHDFDPGQSAVRDQDIDFRDGVLMGRDYLSPPTWTFEMTTNRREAAGALDSLAALSGVWRGDWSRAEPGRMSVLRYQLGGRVRRVYGRPRRWRSSVNDALWQGFGGAVADFKLADARSFSDTMHVEVIGLDASEGIAGGLTAPLVTPLTTALSGERSGVIDYLDGTAPASPIITLNGPITNPRVEGPGWVIELNEAIPYDLSVVVDTRPWALTAIRSDGKPVLHTLSRWTRLSNVEIPVGVNEILFSGTDSTNTATCEIAWRSAYASL